MIPPTAVGLGSSHLLGPFCVRILLPIGILLCNTVTVPLINATTYKASPDETTHYTLSEALALAGPGDTVFLTDGKYDEPLVTVGGGSEGNPLKIAGRRSAIISGESNGRAVLVMHSWITMKGFTVNGTIDSADEVDSYLNKGVYVLGGGNDDPLDGFIMSDMAINNCGGECVRLKSGVQNAEVSGNTITNCGIYYYRFGKGNNNGEGIYIGTSASQLDDDESPDQCTDITVTGNDITTNGNECVDVKEGASGNVITDNTCSWQMDNMSAAFNIRGNNNTVQDNIVENCEGSGVRLGGWTVQGTQNGVNNTVCGNEFKNTGGLFNIRISPQSEICENSCEEGDCSFEYNWKYKEDVEDIESTWDSSCG